MTASARGSEEVTRLPKKNALGGLFGAGAESESEEDDEE